MRPDLFEQHTVTSTATERLGLLRRRADASVAINIGASFTYYYSPRTPALLWHCHITPPEQPADGHGGQLYVRPRQNRVQVSSSLYAALQRSSEIFAPRALGADILCSNPLPAGGPTVNAGGPGYGRK